MTTNASSTKQRAVLAPLDANAKPSLPSPKMLKDGTVSVIPSTGGTSPLKRVRPASVGGTKRSAEDTCSHGNKKACIEEDDARPHPSPTSSPSTSSIFDTSAAEGDASWATTTTEPDTKAEILRLRLGLASYKLRTGQTGVPLADLQHKPLPPRLSVRAQVPSQDVHDAPSSQESNTSSSTMNTTGTRCASSNSPVEGGAANGLLSLSRANSSV
ncbi:hypothetical protein C2857_006505 [Epichloe festucae Fl1]|uniref:Uncharacterized protein n=1 Tax=Epichloe festucae (strain Fl1) TaxID=877507 RepID=A0A7S9KTX1_EPIFF|nr:hypothetical protein C2857_006505 [Epichloe festucae Fl1]